MVDTVRYGNLPPEIQHRILEPIALALVQKKDCRLIEYLCEHDMLRDPQSVLCWAIYSKSQWLFDRVCASGCRPSAHVQSLAASIYPFLYQQCQVGSKPHPRSYLLQKYLNTGRLKEAIEHIIPGVSSAPADVMERAAILGQKQPVEDVLAFIRAWPGAIGRFLWRACLSGNTALLRHFPDRLTPTTIELLPNVEAGSLLKATLVSGEVATVRLFMELGHDIRALDWSNVGCMHGEMVRFLHEHHPQAVKEHAEEWAEHAFTSMFAALREVGVVSPRIRLSAIAKGQFDILEAIDGPVAHPSP